MNEKAIELAQAMREDPGIHKFFSGDRFCPNDRQAFADHFYELLSAILDPPAPEPKVDWEKPVRWKCDHTPVDVHCVRNMPNGEIAAISWTNAVGSWIVSTACSDDDRLENTPGPAPAVVELEYEVAVVKHADEETIAFRFGDSTVLAGKDGTIFRYNDHNYHGYKIGTWQRCTVTG